MQSFPHTRARTTFDTPANWLIAQDTWSLWPTFVLEQREWKRSNAEGDVCCAMGRSGRRPVETDFDGCWVGCDVTGRTLMLSSTTAYCHVVRYPRVPINDGRQPMTVLAVWLHRVNKMHTVTKSQSSVYNGLLHSYLRELCILIATSSGHRLPRSAWNGTFETIYGFRIAPHKFSSSFI